MKSKLIIMGVISMLCSIIGCTAKAEGFKSVGVEEFEQAIADTSAIRLDVRTADEYAEGHIAGARNMDVLRSDFASNTSQLSKDKTVCLYCRSGNRSKKAAAILSRQGYNVIELSTGYKGWVNKGKPVVK